eukprot:c6027_g1_i1.p1 GENE.c6027_g1_i1~~c6027_g1_i1.p1  ORF type:complete len:469 (-),score=78.87 c6027_g1_i1:43-1413(-)
MWATSHHIDLSLQSVFVGMSPDYWPPYDLPFLLSLSVEDARTFCPPAVPGLQQIHTMIPRKNIEAVLATMDFDLSNNRLDYHTQLFFSCAQKRQAGAPDMYNDLRIVARTHIDCVNRNIIAVRDRLQHDPKYSNLLAIEDFSKPGEALQDKYIPPDYKFQLFLARSSGLAITVSLAYMASRLHLRVLDQMPLWQISLQQAPYFREFVETTLQPYLRQVLRESERVNGKFQEELSKAVRNIDGASHSPAPIKKAARAQQKLLFDYLPEHLVKLQWAHPQMISNNMYCVRWRKRRNPSAGDDCPMVLFKLLLCPLTSALEFVYGVIVWTYIVLIQTFVSIPFIVREVGNASIHITDGARAIVVCDTIESCVAVHEQLMKEFNVVRVKNRWKSAEEGYVEVLYNVRLDNVVCEVQVTHTEIYQWRSKTHKPYKIQRANNWESLFSDLQQDMIDHAHHNP